MCSGFIDIETNTNPIDRSIAHLLFHRPLDISVVPPKDAVSFNSRGTVSLLICFQILSSVDPLLSFKIYQRVKI